MATHIDLTDLFEQLNIDADLDGQAVVDENDLRQALTQAGYEVGGKELEEVTAQDALDGTVYDAQIGQTYQLTPDITGDLRRPSLALIDQFEEKWEELQVWFDESRDILMGEIDEEDRTMTRREKRAKNIEIGTLILDYPEGFDLRKADYPVVEAAVTDFFLMSRTTNRSRQSESAELVSKTMEAVRSGDGQASSSQTPDGTTSAES